MVIFGGRRGARRRLSVGNMVLHYIQEHLAVSGMRAVQERRHGEDRDWPECVCLSVWCVKKVVGREDDTTTGSMRQFGGR